MPTFEAVFALTRPGRALFLQWYCFQGAAGFPPPHRGTPGSHLASLEGCSGQPSCLGPLVNEGLFHHQKDVEMPAAVALGSEMK